MISMLLQTILIFRFNLQAILTVNFLTWFPPSLFDPRMTSTLQPTLKWFSNDLEASLMYMDVSNESRERKKEIVKVKGS